jgi:hypothetical protein
MSGGTRHRVSGSSIDCSRDRTIAWAYVTNGMMAFQASEAEYRAFGYEPDYDNLPWKENYDAAKGHEERFKH